MRSAPRRTSGHEYAWVNASRIGGHSSDDSEMRGRAVLQGSDDAARPTAPRQRVTLPTFLIIGAAKSGTTSLYRYLEQHADVFMSPVKETLYFAPEFWAPAPDGSARGIRTLADYEALFAGAPVGAAVGEASPQYLASREAPRLIHEALPDVRLVAILRDPAERAYSAYLHLVRDGVETIDDFRRALAAEDGRRAEGADQLWLYRDGSMYHDQLVRYFGLFPRSHVRVHLYEDFAADPAAVTKDVLEFVGVTVGDFEPDVSLRFNPGGIPRSARLHDVVGNNSLLRRAMMRLPAKVGRDVLVRVINRNLAKPGMPADIRAELVEEFRPEVERLEVLLGRDLASWKT
ncbi:MAG: hypothetical protein QOG87_2766 [Actinomycetota bacterium]